MTLLVSVLFSIVGFDVLGQTTRRATLSLAGGYSKHGSGDFKGLFVDVGFYRQFGRKFRLGFDLATTIHTGRDAILINDNVFNNRTIDGSVRFTTAGIQFGAGGEWRIIRNRHYEVALGISSILRYQSASNGDDGYNIYLPSQTGQPTVLVGFDNKTPQQTISLGFAPNTAVYFISRKGSRLGPVISLQLDSHDDVIFNAGLKYTKEL
jgi:hypothetical protein